MAITVGIEINNTPKGIQIQNPPKPLPPAQKPDIYRKQKIKTKKKKQKSTRSYKNKHTNKNDFYLSRSWLELRYKALKLNDGKCCCCGRGRKQNVVLHVDHIKPRSLYPSLQLDINNLQILCEECNIGKSNKDFTDWR
jgi:5-methylcytosine-specific restriction endonuclease McrA